MPKNPASNGSPEMQVAVLSETGRRPENQDWMSWSQIPWGECYIIADGMGGYKGGALAARMTVEGLEKYLKAQSSDRPFEQALQEAVSRTNEEVYRKAQSGDPETDHMGSTLAVALISGNQLKVGHVGDSRIYLFRRGRLKLLTTDHTSVQRMLDSGMITVEQARTHPDAHILSRAIGSKADVEIEIGKPILLEPGDGILLCSDGLSGYVPDKQIEKLVIDATDVQRIPKKLVDLALEAGGDDNITVQYVRYGKPLKTRRRDTAKLGAFHERLPGGRPALWAAGLALALVLAFYVGRLIDGQNAPKQIAGNQVPSASEKTPATAPASQTKRVGSQDKSPQKDGKKTGTKDDKPSGTQAKSLADAQAGTLPPTTIPPAAPDNAASTAKDAQGSIQVVVLAREDDEEPLARDVLGKIQGQVPVAFYVKADASAVLGDPPNSCSVIYPKEQGKDAAKNLISEANNLQQLLQDKKVGGDRCPDHKWKLDTYQAGDKTLGYVQQKAGQQHLLIAFPKKKRLTPPKTKKKGVVKKGV